MKRIPLIVVVSAMYIYAFDRYANIDRVFLSNLSDIAVPKYRAGELRRMDQHLYILILGSNISFMERYTIAYKHTPLSIDKEFPPTKIFALQAQTMQTIHRMVTQRYTTYKKIIPLFLTNSIIKYHRLYKKSPYPLKSLTKKVGQKLYVFPNVWTMNMQCPQSFFDGSRPEVIVLHSSLTDRQKIVAADKIRRGAATTVCATSSEIFHDRYNLKTIKIIDPYKRYYVHQQDPRYKTDVVINYMKNFYKINEK